MRMKNETTQTAASPLVERVERLLADPSMGLALGAALRARDAGAPDALVLAALLHEFSEGDVRGPRIAAAWLGRAFGPSVAEPVRLVPDAFRWLATVDREWLESAEPDALEDVRRAGGPLDPSALRSFERRPFAQDAIRLARWIDAERRGPSPHDAAQDVDWTGLVKRLVGDDVRAAS